jgi:hypothetical protein
MNESLRYGSVDQAGQRFLVLSSTTYATGDLPSWAVGWGLLSNGESVNVESPRLDCWGVSRNCYYIDLSLMAVAVILKA